MELRKIKIAISIVSIIGVSLIFYSIFKQKKQSKGLNKRVAKILEGEYTLWNPVNGKKKTETDSDVKSLLDSYWKSVGSSLASVGTNTAWSSAFISYVFKKAGANNDFSYSPLHSTYINQSIKNRKEDNKKPFYGYKIGEKKVEVGDIITYPRQSGVSYDNHPSTYSSHGDAIYEVDYKNRIAKGIGGNVSNSVSISSYKLDDKGRLIPQEKGGYPLLAHIKNESK